MQNIAAEKGVNHCSLFSFVADSKNINIKLRKFITCYINFFISLLLRLEQNGRR